LGGYLQGGRPLAFFFPMVTARRTPLQKAESPNAPHCDKRWDFEIQLCINFRHGRMARRIEVILVKKTCFGGFR
jgi:hypothetical protein